VSAWCQVTTTLPDQETAARLANLLVQERLVACAQVVGPISSTYWWNGAVEHSAEWYCYLKTTMTRLDGLKRRLRELHPYEVPELIAVPLVDGDQQYLKWIEDSVGTPAPGQEG
jgi:periplasmic divalent cation tolerance protein